MTLENEWEAQVRKDFENDIPGPHGVYYSHLLDGYLARARKDRREVYKWEKIARCPYQHYFAPVIGRDRGYCSKCGWFQTMSEVVGE